MTNHLRQRLDSGAEATKPAYVPRTPQQVADARNAAMAARNPHRLGEVEWYVTHDGGVSLRDTREFTRARTERIDVAAERARQDWKRAQARGRAFTDWDAADVA